MRCRNMHTVMFIPSVIMSTRMHNSNNSIEIATSTPCGTAGVFTSALHIMYTKALLTTAAQTTVQHCTAVYSTLRASSPPAPPAPPHQHQQWKQKSAPSKARHDKEQGEQGGNCTLTDMQGLWGHFCLYVGVIHKRFERQIPTP